MSSNDKKTHNRKRFFKSVTFQSWVSFLALVFIIIVIMVAAFLSIYGAFYFREKTYEAESTARLVVAGYPSQSMTAEDEEAFHTLLDENCRKLSMTVAVFTADDITSDNAEAYDVLVYYGHFDDETESSAITGDETYMKKLREADGKEFSYVTPVRSGSVFTLGASKMSGGKRVYFYVTAFINDMDPSFNFVVRLNMLISLVVFAISLIFVFFVVRRISGPLVNFTKEIKKARDDENYVLKVKGNGYTEIDELAQTLNDSVAAQRQTEELRRDLVANVSHDLRTPLTMIKAYAEMIRDLSGDNPQKRGEHCTIIINEVETLNVLVSDLLDLSKIQAGTVEMIKNKESLSGLVLSVLERLDIFRVRDGYEFITEIQNDCFVSCDYARTEQAVYNLICNAINYTGADKKVFVRLKKQDGRVRFEVKDTGKGIKEEEIDSIWNKYYRSARAKRTVAGSGIGLSIVQNVFEKQGFSYGVESKENEGSTFWFKVDEEKE